MNVTNPNLTEHCWLCYKITPPFYEAVGVITKARRINGTNSAQCLCKKDKNNQQGITLTQVTGKGRCIGSIPIQKRHLCGVITPAIKGKMPADWLLPAANTRWVCASLGVTPYLSLKLFNESHDYCIQVMMVPKIVYHPK